MDIRVCMHTHARTHARAHTHTECYFIMWNNYVSTYSKFKLLSLPSHSMIVPSTLMMSKSYVPPDLHSTVN